jgi:hypothetical protein
MDIEFEQRLQTVTNSILVLKDLTARRELTTMLNTVLRAYTEVSREAVECRRLHRPTVRYIELTAKSEEMLVELEQYITFGLLIYG